MKRRYSKYLVTVVLLLVITLTACGSDKEAEERKDGWAEYFPYRMVDCGLLTEDMAEELPQIYQEYVEGYQYYVWGRQDDETYAYTHKMVGTLYNNKLIGMHYKDYTFGFPKLDKPLTREEAQKRVDIFAENFIDPPEKDVLVFKNTPENQYDAIYVQGHVETWTADDYSIAVNLDTGMVVWYHYFGPLKNLE